MNSFEKPQISSDDNLKNKEVELSPNFEWIELENGNGFAHESKIKGKMELIGKEAMFLYEGIEESLQKSWSSLATVLDEKELQKWSKYYDDIKNYDEAWEVIGMANAVIYEDWQNKITDLKTYYEGKPYAFICNSVDSAQDIKQSKSMLKSCSLYTEKSAIIFNQPYGFIFSPKLIVAADSQDLGVDNRTKSLADAFYYHIPVIRSFEEVVSEENDDDYNEVVVLNNKEPEAIFYFEGQDRWGHDNYDMALELQAMNPDLEIITLK